jgi:MEDS: MEthanogen/methylotroph, DcmR Sensory domain
VIYRDAEETLAAFMDGERPSPERFERVVGGLVDEIAARFPNETTRAFGEMVDILLRDGCERAAIALEELWDELAQTRRFALLCGYRLDIFDHEVQKKALPDVLRTHTHVRTSAENATLSAALDKALGDLVDPIEIARIYLDVAEQVPRGKVPHAQAVLGWLSTTDAPNVAKILERTRDHYTRMLGASPA